MNSLLIGPGLPGGMMGSLMSDLEKNLASLNRYLTKNGKPEITQDDLLVRLFDEVELVWPMMGNPPLVTPFSQYVKNAALVNVMQIMKGKERWSLLDNSTWDMMLGKSGRLPGVVSNELKELATDQEREFFEGDPQDLCLDVLDQCRKEMDEKGWDHGQDDEELLEYAMHTTQYLEYKSGKAKESFEADLADRKKEKETPVSVAQDNISSSSAPKNLEIDVNGEKFRVSISYEQTTNESNGDAQANTPIPVLSAELKEILAPLEGKVYLTKEASEKSKKPGDQVKEGDIVCYIEAMKVINAVKADQGGTIAEVCFKEGDEVMDDDVLFKLS